jgi:hypothetical protein
MSSEIKADKWSPASGTSATIGDSGDTYTIPSGVTFANNGTATGFAPTGISSSMTSGTGLSIDSSGRITTPLQPMFSAYASAGQTISNYSDNDVVFGGEDFDVGSNFASNTFTAPIAGKYWFSFKSEVVNAGGWIKVKLIPTGKQYQWRADGSSSGSVAVSFSQLVSMSANDTAKVTIVADDNNYVLAGDSGSTYHQTTFSGYLLG